MTTELDYWMQTLEEHTLDCYEYLVDFNSLKISGLITNCREVISHINKCFFCVSLIEVMYDN